MIKNCKTCAKQNTCPKAKHIENYRLIGSSCSEHEWPDGTILCPECENEMRLMMDYHYEGKFGQLITGDVYHCENCLRDDVIEKRWECLDMSRRQYFHG